MAIVNPNEVIGKDILNKNSIMERLNSAELIAAIRVLLLAIVLVLSEFIDNENRVAKINIQKIGSNLACCFS